MTDLMDALVIVVSLGLSAVLICGPAVDDYLRRRRSTLHGGE